MFTVCQQLNTQKPKYLWHCIVPSILQSLYHIIFIIQLERYTSNISFQYVFDQHRVNTHTFWVPQPTHFRSIDCFVRNILADRTIFSTDQKRFENISQLQLLFINHSDHMTTSFNRVCLYFSLILFLDKASSFFLLKRFEKLFCFVRYFEKSFSF